MVAVSGMDHVIVLAREWQTLIAGLLGVVAGIIAYVGAIRGAGRQVAALKDQLKDMRAARRQADERTLNVIKWAVKVEANRLEAAVSALSGHALPSAPQGVNRNRVQLVIESSSLLRGEREEIALLDDQTRALLQRLASLVDEYNSRIQTAVTVASGPEGHEYPLIDQEILAVVNCLAAAVRKMHSVL
jgi:hypothetical protein